MTSNVETTPIYKLVNRKWKELPSKGDSVGINDPKLKQGYLGDLTKKTVLELEKVLQRQDKLLNNRSFISKLKDGGKQLTERRKEIAEAFEIVKHNNLKPLRDTEVSPEDANAFEWTGNFKSEHRKTVDRDSVELLKDNETDPLRLMATHSIDVPININNSSEANTEEDPLDPATIIQKELEKLDLQDSREQQVTIPSGHNGVILQNSSEYFGSKILESLEQKYKQNATKRPRFKPCMLLKPWVPEKGKIRNPQLWEESSATGPITPNCTNPTQLVSLKQSIQLQDKMQYELKERQIKEASARLSRIKGVQITNCWMDKSSHLLGNSSNLHNYRDTSIQKHILADSDDDDDDDDDVHSIDGLRLIRNSDYQDFD